MKIQTGWKYLSIEKIIYSCQCQPHHPRRVLNEEVVPFANPLFLATPVSNCSGESRSPLLAFKTSFRVTGCFRAFCSEALASCSSCKYARRLK